MKNENMFPGWYRVNNDNHFQYFDGNSLDKSNFEIIDVSKEIKYFVCPRKKPRGKGQRLFLIFTGWLAIFVNFFLIGMISTIGDVEIDTTAVAGLSRILILSIIAYLSTQVGYRWFDTFFSLIPFYGVYYIGKILWRASVLPHRYWTAREETAVFSFSNSDVINAPMFENDKSVNRNEETSSQLGVSAYSQTNSTNKFSEFRRSKLFVILAILALVLPSSMLLAQNTGFLKNIQCGGLSRELENQDLVGRDLWNSYQSEVSNLNEYTMYSIQWYNQVGNVARRTIQVLESDKTGYIKILEKPYCAKDSAEIERRLATVESNIAYLNGVELGDDGERWSVYKGWNSDFYSNYYDFSTLLR